jgi:hypothetical protein
MQLLTARPKSRGTVGLKSTNPFDLAKVCVCVCVCCRWGAASAQPP